MKKLFLIGSLFSSITFAALPPFYQSTKEIDAIVSSRELYEALGSAEMIKKIQRTSEGYVVFTNNYRVAVDVEYLPSNRLGPVAFKLHVQKPMSLK